MAGDEPEKGDKVSWPWGGGAPGGTVADKKKEGEIAITSKRGNKIKKNAEPNDPAVHVERSGNDVVKKASELNVEKKASGSKDNKDEDDKKDGDKKNEKRKLDDGEAADDGKNEPLVKNAEGKEVKPGGKGANKKQKQEKEEKAKKETKKDGNKKDEKKKEESKPEEEKAEEKEAPSEKRKPGRPKGSGDSKKGKKDPTPRQDGDLVSSRTRSRGK